MLLPLRAASRQNGNAIILTLIGFTLLFGMSMAQVSVFVKNSQQASFFNLRTNLRSQAESGISLAVHELRYRVSASPGMIGTEAWSITTDFGYDGVGGTLDMGEGDGIPSRGEPGVAAVPVGPAARGMGNFVYWMMGATPEVVRVVSTAFSGSESVTVEKFFRRTLMNIPKVGAVYVEPGVAIDLKGNSFTIDGNDHNPDGTPGTGDAVLGIATIEGDPPGDNQAGILAQIDSSSYDQISGAGDGPVSVEEVPSEEVDLGTMIDEFLARVTNSVEPGTYSGVSWGDFAAGDLPVTVVEGDLHLFGAASGAGVLVVDGALVISGQFAFTGLVLVRGDVHLTGGGSGVHITGALMVTESFNAIDSLETEITLGGSADVYYSATVLDTLTQAMNNSFVGGTLTALYYVEK